ncbi:MAG: hypothetical protein ACJARN_001113, partial [Arenicella sp.]
MIESQKYGFQISWLRIFATNVAGAILVQASALGYMIRPHNENKTLT